MKKSSPSNPGLRAGTHLRAGFYITDLDSFSKALIENIRIYDNRAIHDDEVEYCGSSFNATLDCLDWLNPLYPDIVETAMKNTVEYCKQTHTNGQVCDDWGDQFGLPFGHG